VLTVLTSPAARILDVLYVFQDDQELGALTLPGGAAATSRYLKSRIFFMDKVEVVDQSEQCVRLLLVGPQALRLAQALTGETRLPANAISLAHTAGFSAHLLVPEPFFLPGLALLVAASHLGQALDWLEAQGAVALSPAAYHCLRVEAGLPEVGFELSEEYTPLEAGLSGAVADDKGCYTGQEIIARQVTYDKVTQQLCALRLAQPAQPGERLWAQGKLVGKVTSTAGSPRFGPLALGMVKRPYFAVGSALRVGAEETSASAATVIQAPWR
jgi:folate-binding protein YgfZ